MGGTSDPSANGTANLLVLCGSGTTGCHGWVESNRASARDLGLLVSQWDTPDDIPYTDLQGKTWRLDGEAIRYPHPG
jgi:hypothetical protein